MPLFQMTKEDIESGLSELGQICFDNQHTIDLGVYGGSALILGRGFQRTTGDIDAVVIPQEEDVSAQSRNTSFLKVAAKEVCQRRNWPEDWFNDSAKVFISPKVDYHQGLEFLRSFPNEASHGLKLFIPNPLYQLAMKLFSCREASNENPKSDRADIVNLMVLVKPESIEELVKIGAVYYPEIRILGKLHMQLRDIWSEYENALRKGLSAPQNFGRGGPEA